MYLTRKKAKKIAEELMKDNDKFTFVVKDNNGNIIKTFKVPINDEQLEEKVIENIYGN